MSSQGSAKAPDLRVTEPEKQKGQVACPAEAQSSSAWQTWKQVVIGEILNVLERRRYDKTQLR